MSSVFPVSNDHNSLPFDVFKAVRFPPVSPMYKTDSSGDRAGLAWVSVVRFATQFSEPSTELTECTWAGPVSLEIKNSAPEESITGFESTSWLATLGVRVSHSLVAVLMVGSAITLVVTCSVVDVPRMVANVWLRLP